jgi:hypothetical protein
MSDRSEYYRAYHAAHRARRNAAALRRYYENRERILAKCADYLAKNRAARKVARNLRVTIGEARAMLEARA